MEPPSLAIQVFQPRSQGYAWTQNIDRPATYQHTIQAVGGYWSMDFSVAGDLEMMDEFVADGLGRQVVVTDDALDICWEGFINQVDAVYGPLSVTRGPLLDVANRVNVVYSGVDISVNPPAVGVQTETGVANDTDSQALYGTIEKVLSTGAVSATDAGNIQATYMAEHALPATTQTFSSASAPPTSITVHCLGYVHWFAAYVYNQTTNVGTRTTDVKLTDIIAANPNIAWLPFDTTHIETPAAPVSVPRYEYENLVAWDLIKDTVARGDTNAARWLFGIYENLECHYSMAPTTVEYDMSLSDPALRVMREHGELVPYWNVLPGRWLLFTDFLPGRSVPSSLREDPRAMFIEAVTFSAPNSLTLRGGKFETLPQILAAKGLGGIGA